MSHNTNKQSLYSQQFLQQNIMHNYKHQNPYAKPTNLVVAFVPCRAFSCYVLYV